MRKIFISFISMLFCAVLPAQNSVDLESPYYVFPRSGDSHIDLSADWSLTSVDAPVASLSDLVGSDWLKVESPTSAQMAYFRAGRLPDPYLNLNSELYKPVGKQIHYYKKTFLTPEFKDSDNVMLTFDGVDYQSRLWVNGTCLGQHKGMFGGPCVKINDVLRKDGRLNEVVVEVTPGNYGNPEFNARNKPGNTVRTWFFSDQEVTPFFHVGMWNGVRLEILPGYHIERPFLSTKAIEGGKAVLDFSAELFAGTSSTDYILRDAKAVWTGSARFFKYVDKDVKVRVEFRDGDNIAYLKTFAPQMVEGRCWIEEEFTLDNPKLWYPNGLGEQNLYNVNVVLSVDGKDVDSIKFDFGVRTIEHVRTASLRTSDVWNNWQYVINGKKIFLKGMNWLPLDALSDLSYEHYEWDIRAARDLGVQLIRIWGSGYMETEKFYDICDKYGIMVWQDFTVANAETPEWPRDIWEAQVCQNIYRLRNRASLAVWCGGNEFNPYAGNTSTIGIVERSLHDLDPTRMFVRSTPDGGSAHIYNDFDPNWYKKYTELPYVAETGIHTMCCTATGLKVVAADQCKDLGGMYKEEFKNTHPDFVHHFAEYSAWRVPRMLSRASHVEDISDPSYEEVVEATNVGAGEFYQIMSESLQSMYPVTTGMMPWVLNRPWPVVGGIQILDYFGQPTGPYYFLKRTYEQTHVMLDLPRMLFAPGDSFDINAKVLNGLGAGSFEGKVSVRIMDDRFKELKSFLKEISVKSGVSVSDTVMGDFEIPADYHKKYFFITVKLTDSEGRIVSRSNYWPRTLDCMEDTEYYNKFTTKHTEWPILENGPWLKPTVAKSKTVLAVSPLTKDADGTLSLTVTNKGKYPSPMTTLEADGCVWFASDNFFWLEPGESKTLKMSIKTSDPVPSKVRVMSWNAKTVNAE